MIARTVTISLIVFAVVVFWYTDFGAEAKVYDCTANLNNYPKHIATECQQLIDEYRRQEEKKESIIYI